MSETKQVPEEFRARLQAARDGIAALKGSIGENELVYEQRKAQLFDRIGKADQAALALARDAALAAGIDPNASSHVFDWGTLEFRAVGVPAGVPHSFVVMPKRHALTQGVGRKGKRRR